MKIKRIPVGIYGANCYILIDEEINVGCVIDPGGDDDIIIKEIENSNAKIKFILLTHGHVDHVEAVNPIKEKYSIPVYINSKDKKLMEVDESVFGALWKTDDKDKEISDGEILELGNLKIQCIETPGHTPGGMCFFVNNVVFTGDTLFNLSVGRTDFPGGSHKQLIESIKTKLMTLGDDVTVLPGHMRESKIKFERDNNPFL